MLLYLILILLFILYLLNKFKLVIYVHNILVPVCCIVFIVALMVFSGTAVSSARNGLNLWLNVVLPSLLPFLIVSEILGSTGFIRATGVFLEPVMRPLFNEPGHSSFAFIMGITSGYPVGAKITTNMRQEGLLTKNEADRLLAFSNNSGPLFMIGAVATTLLKAPQLGSIILVSHIAACSTVGILFRFILSKNSSNPKNRNIRRHYNLRDKLKYELKNSLKNSNNQTRDIGTLIGQAIYNSLNTMLMVGGFIILFSVIINLLNEIGIISIIAQNISAIITPIYKIDKNVVAAVLSGVIEVTTGANMICSLETITLLQKTIILSFIIGWAGISVHFQVMSIIAKSDISPKYYFIGKFLQGVISSFYTYILFLILQPSLLKAVSVFSHEEVVANSWYLYLFTSIKYLAAGLLLLVAGKIIFITRSRILGKKV